MVALFARSVFLRMYGGAITGGMDARWCTRGKPQGGSAPTARTAWLRKQLFLDTAAHRPLTQPLREPILRARSAET
jgi:hypothetical protein